MIGIIYKVTNDLNNNVYIGQTVYLLENFLLKYKWKIKDSIIIPRVSRPNQVKLKVKMCSELYGDI